MTRNRFLGLMAMLAIGAVLTAAGQEAPPAPQSQPTTHNHNGNVHVTTQPGGIMINAKDVSIDSILDELSTVAGFIVVKVDQPQGRVTLVSKQPVPAED